MVNYLSQVAVKGNKNRKEAILRILSGLGVKFRMVGEATENIVVSFNPSSSRLVIGAHYDAAREDIEAANDNASACVILLNLISDLRDTSKSIDFVFFDKEEQGFLGSDEYIRITGEKNIKACLNLDMCGLGHNLVLSHDDMGKPVFEEEPYKSIIGDCPNLMSSLPPGDTVSFEGFRIPYIFLVNSTDHDLAWYRAFACCSYQARTIIPDWAKSMHQPSDTVSSLDPSGMELIYAYLAKRL